MSTNLKKSGLLTLSIICLASLFLSSSAMAAIVDHGEIVKGQVTITRTSEYDVIIGIDRAPVDGAVDLAFVYRSATALPSDLFDFNGDATVLVRPSSVLVKRRNDRDVVFAVTTAEDHAPHVLAKKADSLFIDSGYQLSRLHGGDVGARAVRMVAQTLLLKEEAGCWAGGEGSTGCSLEGGAGPIGAGCSVTCGEGYYSCCNPTSGCQCESGGGGGGGFEN